MIQRWLALLLVCCLHLGASADFPRLAVPQGVGVNIHFTRGHERDLDLIAAAGCKWIRMDFSWGATEQRKGEYNWSDYEELTANLEKRGISAIYILDYSNSLYEKDNAAPRTPESVAAFAKWAGAAADHFKGRPIVWEIWNEPNIFFWKPKPNVQDYIRLAKATCEALRQNDRQARIVAPASSEFPWEFFEAMFKAGLLEQLDAVSVHPYRTYSRTPETAAEDYLRLRAMIEQYAPPGKKAMPILSGEWGYASHDKGVSLETQAAFIVRQQLANLLNRVPISIWYDWKNDGPKPDDAEHNFGTVHNDLRPKPAYVALQTMTRELSGFVISRRMEVDDPDTYLLLFTHPDGQQKVAAWSRVGNRKATLHTGLNSADEVTIVDGQGSRQPAVLDQGSLRLDLQAAPVYVSFKEPSVPLQAAAAWNLKEPYARAVEAGTQDGLVLKAELRNPFPAAVSVSLGLTGPGVSIRKEARLAAGRSKEVRFTGAVQRRDLPQVVMTLAMEMRDQDGKLVGENRETLRFRVSNPLTLQAAPVETGLRIQVANPTAAAFKGRLQIGEQKQPVTLTRAEPNATLLSEFNQAGLEHPGGPVRLTTPNGLVVAELPSTRYHLLGFTNFVARLDGDEKIAASASIEEVKAPGENPPWSKVFALNYDFGEGWRFVRCDGGTSMRFDARPKDIGVWVFGDNSGNLLRLRLRDSQGQTFQPSGPAVNWTGWRWVTFDLDHLNEAGHWGGANDGVVRGALTLDTPLLLDGSRRKTAGRIYFAGLAAMW